MEVISCSLFIKAKINIAGPSSRSVRRMNQDSEFTKGTEIQVYTIILYVLYMLCVYFKCGIVFCSGSKYSDLTIKPLAHCTVLENLIIGNDYFFRNLL